MARFEVLQGSGSGFPVGIGPEAIAGQFAGWNFRSALFTVGGGCFFR